MKEETNLSLKFNKNYFIGRILLTNKNILIFFDTNKDSALKGSGVQVMPEYALLTKIPLKELKYTANNEETLINDITIYNFNLKEFFIFYSFQHYQGFLHLLQNALNKFSIP